MTSGYFEDIEVGDSRKAGPYFVSKAEIIQFAKQYDPRPPISTRKLLLVPFLQDCRHLLPTRSRSSSRYPTNINLRSAPLLDWAMMN